MKNMQKESVQDFQKRTGGRTSKTNKSLKFNKIENTNNKENQFNIFFNPV